MVRKLCVASLLVHNFRRAETQKAQTSETSLWYRGMVWRSANGPDR